MKTTLKLVLLTFVASQFVACAPQLQNAIKVGGREPATWVFISVANSNYQGVYRCKETEKGPVCTKAKIAEQ